MLEVNQIKRATYVVARSNYDEHGLYKMGLGLLFRQPPSPEPGLEDH